MTGMPPNLDQDSLEAGVDLIGRTGARDFQVGYLHDDVPCDQAGWYATATYQGAKVISEDHKGPVEAVEALARRLLTGAKCVHCEGLIALSDHGAVFYPGARLADGSAFTELQAREMPQCRYRRVDNKWGARMLGPAEPGSSAREATWRMRTDAYDRLRELECPDCGRREDVEYRSTQCDERFVVSGRYVWHWQGKGHYHEADGDVDWSRTVSDHVAAHGGDAVIVPASWDVGGARRSPVDEEAQ